MTLFTCGAHDGKSPTLDKWGISRYEATIVGVVHTDQGRYGIDLITRITAAVFAIIINNTSDENLCTINYREQSM